MLVDIMSTLEPIDFQEPCIDFIVCSEGTVPFRKLLEQIENNTKIFQWLRVCS